MRQALRFTFEDHDYFIQFAYKQDHKAWDASVAKNSKWTPKMLATINEAIEAIAEAHGLGKVRVMIDDLENPPSLKQNNVTICEILRGPVGASTKEMVSFFRGMAHRAVMDNFEKEEGRKHALTHALKDANGFTELLKEAEIELCESAKCQVFFSQFRHAAWEAYNNRRELSCPECDAIGVRTHWRIEDVHVGVLEAQIIKVHLPVRECAVCHFEWTDDEAAKIRDAAVKELKVVREQSALEKHLEKVDVPQE